MANFTIIRDIAESKGMTIRELAGIVGMTDISIHTMIKNGSTNTTTLEKIAKALDVPIGIFFGENIDKSIGHKTNGDNSPISGNIKVKSNTIELEKAKIKIEYLEKIVNDKEQIIELLKSKK